MFIRLHRCECPKHSPRHLEFPHLSPNLFSLCQATERNARLSAAECNEFRHPVQHYAVTQCNGIRPLSARYAATDLIEGLGCPESRPRRGHARQFELAQNPCGLNWSMQHHLI